ncbi:MAG: FG-GAP-like repeat-containing protein [Thermoplasmata archaeon]
MRALGAAILLIIAILPSPIPAGDITTFQDGATEAIVQLFRPGLTGWVNLSVPAGAIVRSAGFDVSSVVSDGTGGQYPDRVRIYLNETVLWEFSGPGYGALGRQDTFLCDSKEMEFGFGEEGGAASCSIRLMRYAVVKSARMELSCDGGGWYRKVGGFGPQKHADYFSFSVAGAGDVNGDGYDDVIIGEPMNSSIGLRCGRAYIYFGGPVINKTADVTLTGEGELNYFGVSVAGPGDLNGDGFDDVIVGASYCAKIEPRNDLSRAYIFFGGAPMDSTPDIVLEGAPNSSFGISVAGAGDVNGDEFPDVVVGAPNTTNQYGAGRAFVYFGGPDMDNVSDAVLSGGGWGDGFGRAVSGAGDFNNDSWDDVIVGACTGVVAPESDATGNGAWLFLGGENMDGVADLRFGSEEAGDLFGATVAGIGDENGDGYEDVVVGAPGANSSRGSVYVYLGGPKPDSAADFVLDGTNSGDLFGASVSAAGDVNADGLGDLVVTAPGYPPGTEPGAGAAFMFCGGEDIRWNRNRFYVGYGQTDGPFLTGASAGDVDGDGHDEVILGAPVNDICGLYAHGDDGIDRPELEVGGRDVWMKTSYFKGTETTLPFPNILQNFLCS